LRLDLILLFAFFAFNHPFQQIHSFYSFDCCIFIISEESDITDDYEREEDMKVEINNHVLFDLLFWIFTRFPAFGDFEGLVGVDGLNFFPVLPSLPITLA
jgi:hypothetical protein